jgi:hypothetical protein
LATKTLLAIASGDPRALSRACDLAIAVAELRLSERAAAVAQAGTPITRARGGR